MSREAATVAAEIAALPSVLIRGHVEPDGGYCRKVRDRVNAEKFVDVLHTGACTNPTPGLEPEIQAGCVEPGTTAPTLIVSGPMAGFTKHPDGRLVSPLGPTIHTRGPGFDCCDCGLSTIEIGEASYFLHNELWRHIMSVCPPTTPNPVGTEMLCVACCEARLGRELTPADFKPGLPINDDPAHAERSARLRSRMVTR